MHDYTYTTESNAEPQSDGALARLDQEVERLNVVVDLLTKRLSPVLISRPEVASMADTIKAMPESELRERIDRLASTTARIDRLMRDLDI